MSEVIGRLFRYFSTLFNPSSHTEPIDVRDTAVSNIQNLQMYTFKYINRFQGKTTNIIDICLCKRLIINKLIKYAMIICFISTMVIKPQGIEIGEKLL